MDPWYWQRQQQQSQIQRQLQQQFFLQQQHQALQWQQWQPWPHWQQPGQDLYWQQAQQWQHWQPNKGAPAKAQGKGKQASQGQRQHGSMGRQGGKGSTGSKGDKGRGWGAGRGNARQGDNRAEQALQEGKKCTVPRETENEHEGDTGAEQALQEGTKCTAPRETGDEHKGSPASAANPAKFVMLPLDQYRNADKATLLRLIETTSALGFRYANVALRDDRDVVLAVVKKSGEALQLASERLRGDKEIVLAAVSHSGAALSSASADLQADKEVVAAAVRHDGFALQYADGVFQADEEIVLEAVRKLPIALNFADPGLKANKDFMLLAARASGAPDVCYNLVPDAIRRDLAWEKFTCAVLSALEVRGQQAPILSVTLSSQSEAPTAYLAKACLISGATLEVEVREPTRPEPVLADLAATLVQELQKLPQVEPTKYVFVNFPREDGDHVATSVWDCDRPLSEFLFAS